MNVINVRESNASHGVGYPSVQAKDTYSGDAGRESGKREILVEYAGDMAWRAHIPAVGAAHPVLGWLEFKSYTMSQKVVNAVLVLVYEQTEFSAGGGGGQDLPELPEVEPDENGSVLEIDVVKHPKFNTDNPGWGGLSMRDFYNPREGRMFMGPTIPAEYVDEDGVTKANVNAGEAVPEEIAGMDKYVVGTGTVTVREYSYNEPAHVIPNAGKRGVPAGYSGTADYWLIMSGSRGKDGAFWYRDMVYQYSAKAISGWVYDDI